MHLNRLPGGTAGLFALLALIAATATPALAQTGVIQGQVVDAASRRPLSRCPDPGRGHRSGPADQLLGALRAPECSRRRARCARSPDRLRRDGPVRFAGGGADRHGRHRDVVNGHFPERDRGYRRGGGNYAPRPWYFGRSAHRGGLRTRAGAVLDQLLQGRVSGATVSATSAQPGTGALISFRGASSVFGAQTPVIYVDGVRVDNDHATAAGTGGEQSSALADLLSSDIERIEVTRGRSRVNALRLGRGHRGHSRSSPRRGLRGRRGLRRG